VWLSHACLAKTLLKRSESALDNQVLACVFSKYLLNKQFTDGLSNKPFLIWLLTTPLHLRYVARLHCNLSLMACFADITVSQGSVTTYARRGGIFNIHLTTNLHRNFPVDFFNRLRFDRVMLMSLWPHFFGPPCMFIAVANGISFVVLCKSGEKLPCGVALVTSWINHTTNSPPQ